MGILEPGGKVRTTVIPNRKKKALQPEVRKHVEAGSTLYSDALLSYDGLAGKYAHKIIDHAVQYVDGTVHTNGLENFWNLLKRGLSGTYVSGQRPVQQPAGYERRGTLKLGGVANRREAAHVRPIDREGGKVVFGVTRLKKQGRGGRKRGKKK